MNVFVSQLRKDKIVFGGIKNRTDLLINEYVYLSERSKLQILRNYSYWYKQTKQYSLWKEIIRLPAEKIGFNVPKYIFKLKFPI